MCRTRANASKCRAEVRRLLVRTAWRAPFPRAWQRLWPQIGPGEVGSVPGGDSG